MLKFSVSKSFPVYSIVTYSCLNCFENQYRNIYSQKKDYSEFFKILNICEKSDQHAVREAFLKLAKKYHPDSKNAEASAEKFQSIENAYKKLLQKFSQDRRNNDCEGEFGLYYEQKRQENITRNEEYDIEHTAPQHRQYLSYEGIGIGTPSQRQKQFTKYRAMRAAENIIDYKIQQLSEESETNALTTKDKKTARDIRTRYGIDRLVEDKIQESIARGDFDSLPNAGKPLKFQNHNPFVDIVTHKLNQIKWSEFQTYLSSDVSELNRKIDKYNLVVPMMTKQTVHFPIARVGDKILREGKTKDQTEKKEDSVNIVLEKEIPSPRHKEEFGIKAIIGMFRGR